jgi:hypothetical protein
VTLLLLALGLALGAPEPAEDAEAGEEIVVYGELRVKEARAKVVADLEALGFTRVKDKDGKLVMRHAQNWKGKVVFHDDGRLQFKRQPPEAAMPDTFFKRASPLVGWVPCVVVPTACVKVGGWVVSERKLGAVHRDARAAVDPSLQDLSERQADLAIDRKLDDLDARLAACWERGVPLDGDASQILSTPAERRLHLLRFWQTRTDTVWGDRMRDPVEGFLRNVVQESEHPVTAEELVRVNADREGLRQLELPVAPPPTK